MNLKNSQNFLFNKKLVDDLVKNSNICKDDLVLEVGPGKGIITNSLSRYAKKVVAIEYDRNLFEMLVKENQSDNILYKYGDFLSASLPNQKYKVFSNIPFQITANIIKKLTEGDRLADDIYLIIQREAAKKYCGIPFQKIEGLRASIVKLRYNVSIEYKFNKTDFTPKPNVDIVLLHLSKKNGCMNDKLYHECRDLISYIYLCKCGESAKERLSTLFTNLQVKRLASDNGINLADSYTKITSKQWISIFEYSKIGLSEEKKKKLTNSYRKIENRNKGLKKQNRNNKRK